MTGLRRAEGHSESQAATSEALAAFLLPPSTAYGAEEAGHLWGSRVLPRQQTLQPSLPSASPALLSLESWQHYLQGTLPSLILFSLQSSPSKAVPGSLHIIPDPSTTDNTHGAQMLFHKDQHLPPPSPEARAAYQCRMEGQLFLVLASSVSFPHLWLQLL